MRTDRHTALARIAATLRCPFKPIAHPQDMIGRARVEGQFDVYNLLNANPVLALNTRYGAAWQFPTNVLPGRLVKFGVQLTF